MGIIMIIMEKSGGCARNQVLTIKSDDSTILHHHTCFDRLKRNVPRARNYATQWAAVPADYVHANRKWTQRRGIQSRRHNSTPARQVIYRYYPQLCLFVFVLINNLHTINNL